MSSDSHGSEAFGPVPSKAVLPGFLLNCRYLESSSLPTTKGSLTVKLMKARPSADHWNAAASHFFLPGLDLVGPSHPSSPPQPFRPPCTFSLDLNGYLLSHLFTISCLSGLSCPCLKFWAPKGQGLCLFAVLLVQRLIQQVGVSITAFVSEKAFGSSNSA